MAPMMIVVWSVPLDVDTHFIASNTVRDNHWNDHLRCLPMPEDHDASGPSRARDRISATRSNSRVVRPIAGKTKSVTSNCSLDLILHKTEPVKQN
jgi:hypothetical protein